MENSWKGFLFLFCYNCFCNSSFLKKNNSLLPRDKSKVTVVIKVRDSQRRGKLRRETESELLGHHPFLPQEPFVGCSLISSMKIISRARLLKFRTHVFCSDCSRYFWRRLLSLIPFSENCFCHQRSVCRHVDLSLPRSSIKLWMDHDRTCPDLEQNILLEIEY